MGFAFLPIGIGSILAGRFGGAVLHHFGEVQHRPSMIWWSVTAVGILTTALLFLYDKFLLPKDESSDAKLQAADKSVSA
jgi:integral membrane sensor domain MASE1